MERNIAMFEEFTNDSENTTIELVNAYSLIGPKENSTQAIALAKECNNEMTSAYNEFYDEDDPSDSRQMDERDNVFDLYEDRFKEFGFVIKD